MSKIRVLVVEDSLTVRQHLVEILAGDGEIEVVAEADDGRRCIELCERLRPNVVVLDMVLPVMSGLAATEYIMAYCPTPILIVSASANRGELFKTYDALAAGALDVLEKPNGDEMDGRWEQQFLAKVKLISRISVITHVRGRRKATPTAHMRLSASTSEQPNDGYRVVAIGTSTGGPAAIVEILRALPAGFPLPILLVVHISEVLGGYLAEWIDSQSALRVAYAEDGELLPARGSSRVIMAPPNQHLIVRDGRLRLNRERERHSCRPSVDVMFESIAREMGNDAVACLLTGMGKDGASGLLEIRKAGGFTVAQDEASSIVFGMPQEAIRLQAAQLVLSLADIGPTLVRLATASRRAALAVKA
ncbi:MAG TPA: chemotaxis-specific protein-glutamate methyltransferase CheB [Candidatus Sulfotelmatobacter sp.]|nr:chemotaxis-specific protein-glutamate methyltransferase CheB [Candidatus Sulfotelmatobacter sp.]